MRSGQQVATGDNRWRGDFVKITTEKQNGTTKQNKWIPIYSKDTKQNEIDNARHSAETKRLN